MKALKVGAVAVMLLCVIAWVGVQFFFRSPVPRYGGQERIRGLSQRVEVRFDGFGVPHIFAQNEEDLFFAQGYVTAQERMFQMDMNRRAGRGELSVLLGERTLQADRFLRTAGFYRTARSELETLDPVSRRILEAYTRGVNAYMESLRSMPREYLFLGARMEPWRPEDSVVCGILIAYGLTRSKEADLLFHQLTHQMGEEKARGLFPSFPDSAPPVIRERGAPKTPLPDSQDDLYVLPFIPEIPASNWFVFSGRRTTTGKPLLAGSPDLEPKIPGLFYLVHLRAGDLDVIGGSLPGVPGVNVLGFNGQIAWSTTNGRVDELDYFLEKVNPSNPNQYMTENGWADFQVLEETIRVKAEGGFKDERLSVRISRHGPMVSGLLPLAPEECAMKWVGSEPTGLVRGLDGLHRARSFDEFRRTLSHLRTPSLNFCYADINGNVGYQFAASVPKRKKGDGMLPVPGWTGEYEWEGFVPFEQLPHDYNPETGFLASFNNLPGRTPYFISNFFMFERAMRFQEIVEGQEKFAPEEMTRLQYDSVSAVAKRWVPHILRVCTGHAGLSGAVNLFQGWDFSMDRESAAAALFNAFYFRMMENTLADEVGERPWREQLARPMLIYVPDMVLTRIMEDNEDPWFDDVRTAQQRETRDQVILKSMREAAEELSRRLGNRPEEWRWGRVHRMTFRHPLGSKLPFLNLNSIPTHGDSFTINAGMWDNLNPYEMQFGGCIRMVVDFSNLERSTFMSPPGQSGHFLSPHYDDMAHLWADGAHIPMHYLSGKELTRVLILEPDGG